MKFKKLRWVILLCLLPVAILAFLVFHYNISWNDLASLSFYENLADPSVRIVQIQAGTRKEQVADTLAEDLGWNVTEKNEFLNSHLALNQTSLEGQYFPKTYLIDKNESPLAVTKILTNEFSKETQNIPKTKTTKIINTETALKIASIIQREAAGKNDMRLISGIIWNRIFKGMKLQIDSTVQYAMGNESNWWPEVTPDDLATVNSPYNTYLTTNLPPTPISEPSLDAIKAAYNPQSTSCLYYLHDKNRQIHCSATYQGQLNNIAKYY